MIVEELIALIGFKVDNEEDIARATTWFERMKLRVLEFARAVQTKLRAAMSRLGDFGRRAGGAIARGVAALAGGIARLGVVLAVGAAAFAGIGLAAAGILGVFTTVAAAIASVGGKLAQARRELQLLANAAGTDARKIDALGNVFSTLGATDPETGRKHAEEMLKGIGKVRDEALRGDKDARKKFAADRLSLYEENGQPRDASNLSLDVVQRRYALTARRDAATTPGARKLNDQAVRQFDERYGLDGIIGAMLDAAGSFDEFKRRFQESNARNPTQTPEQENRSRRVAEGWSEFQQHVSAVSGAFSTLAVIVSDNLIPPLNAFASWIVAMGKRFGWINETQGEVDERRRVAKERVDAARGRVERLEAGAAPGETPWQRAARERDSGIKQARQELKRAQEAYDAAMQAAVPVPEQKPPEAPPLPPAAPPAARQPVPYPQPRPWDAGAEPSDKRTMSDWLYDLLGTLGAAASNAPAINQAVSPEGAAERTARTVEQSATTNNVSNVGNDQRQVTVQVSATVNEVPELAPVVRDAVSSALVKSSNATTAPMPGP